MTASASVAVLGGSASFFVPDDYRRAVIGVSGLAAFGAFSTGLTLYGEHSVPTYSTAALAAGSYSSAALLGLNAIIRTPQISRLRAARRRLREPGASSDEVRSRVEADLAQSEPPLSPLLLFPADRRGRGGDAALLRRRIQQRRARRGRRRRGYLLRDRPKRRALAQQLQPIPARAARIGRVRHFLRCAAGCSLRHFAFREVLRECRSRRPRPKH